jgi:hypothetical protein
MFRICSHCDSGCWRSRRRLRFPMNETTDEETRMILGGFYLPGDQLTESWRRPFPLIARQEETLYFQSSRDVFFGRYLFSSWQQ